MPGEKQNSWQQRLEDMEHLPDAVSFDKEAGWEELEQALQKKKRRFGFVWAAALVLLVGSGGFLLYSSRLPSTSAKQGIATRPASVKALPSGNKIEVKKEELTVVEQPAVGKKLQTVSPEIVAPEVSVPTDTIAHYVVPTEAAQVTEQPIVTDITTTAAPSLKKRRFPVAHINELQSRPPEPAKAEESVYARGARTGTHPEYRSSVFPRNKWSNPSSNTNKP